jgi:hypothetical protein
MPDGFQSPNYTQIPNDFFKEYLPIMGDAEVRVMCALMRFTFGYHKDVTRMSIRNLAKASGLSARGAWSGAEQAIKRGLVVKENDGGVTIWRIVVNIETVLPRATPKRQSVARGSTGVARGSTPSIKESSKESEKETIAPTNGASAQTAQTLKASSPKETLDPLEHLLTFAPDLAQLIRKWTYSQPYIDILTEFVSLTGIQPTPRDKGLWLKGAKDWAQAGFTSDDMRVAWESSNKGKAFCVSHIGALHAKAQALRADVLRADGRVIFNGEEYSY